MTNNDQIMIKSFANKCWLCNFSNKPNGHK